MVLLPEIVREVGTKEEQVLANKDRASATSAKLKKQTESSQIRERQDASSVALGLGLMSGYGLLKVAREG